MNIQTNKKRSVLLELVALIIIVEFLLVTSARAQTEVLNSAVATQVDNAYPALEVLYQDIHRYPEIAFEEKHTAARLAVEMRSIGFTVTEGVGKTGLVAIYENGPGPTIMVRTELDALPMEEKTSLPYASRAKSISNGRESFVAHSCGHDLHMASWVGSAQTMIALKDQWNGRLMFIAQPAEETLQGAQAMALLDILIGPISSIIDKIIPDKEAQARAKLELIALEGTQEMPMIEAQLQAIVAEANSKEPRTSRARPSFLYVMYIVLATALPMGVLSAFRPAAA